MKELYYIILLSILLMGCGTASKLSYQYSDGNSNTYTVTAKTISYEPVSKNMSSSGEYSGGKAYTGSIREEEFKAISKLMDAASKNKNILITNRVMMSGMIKIIGKVKTDDYIIDPSCNEKEEIEKFLNELIKE